MPAKRLLFLVGLLAVAGVLAAGVAWAGLFTASTPILPAVTKACFAMIFSTIVIGRFVVVVGGGQI